MSRTSGTNGTNGTSVHAAAAIELETRVARYRTALVALLELVKRDGREFRSWGDQQLVAQIQRIVDEDVTK